MDPLAALWGALVAGAAGALQTTVADAVKDGYAALKNMLTERHKSVDLTTIERDPAAPDAQTALEQQLRVAGVAEDADLVALANVLLERIAQYDRDLATAVGVDLEGIKAGKIRIADVVSAGTGVRVRRAVAAGDFEITGVRAGNVGGTPGKPLRRRK
jgi:hypothetical protein